MLFLVRFPRTPAVTLDILDPALFSGWPGPWTACVVILGPSSIDVAVVPWPCPMFRWPLSSQLF